MQNIQKKKKAILIFTNKIFFNKSTWIGQFGSYMLQCPFWRICSKVETLSWEIICAKLREDFWEKKRFSHKDLILIDQFVWRSYAIVVKSRAICSETVALPSFVKIYCQMKKFFIHKLHFERSLFMAAICYSGPISVVRTNMLLWVQRTCAKFQIDISNIEGLIRVYIDGQTDGYG